MRWSGLIRGLVLLFSLASRATRAAPSATPASADVAVGDELAREPTCHFSFVKEPAHAQGLESSRFARFAFAELDLLNKTATEEYGAPLTLLDWDDASLTDATRDLGKNAWERARIRWETNTPASRSRLN